MNLFLEFLKYLLSYAFGILKCLDTGILIIVYLMANAVIQFL